MKDMEKNNSPLERIQPEATPANQTVNNPGYLSDKGDFRKTGSMQEAYTKEEGYFTMDEDEGKETERENDSPENG